jgi:hypothetical protein
MGEAADLKYHADALRLLAVAPRFDGDAADRIARAEAACGRHIPAAVTEWYTLADAEELLTLDDNACGVTPLADFLHYFIQGRTEVEFYGPRRVNTGYQAFVRLDGGDDPPVLVDAEPGVVSFAEYVRGLAEYKVSSGL